MKNIFHKNGRLKAFCLSLVVSLSLSELGAEEDGFFFGIDYQASLARQNIKNPGYASAQALREEIKQGAQSVNSAAVPLAYYLELLGSKTVELMSQLCKGTDGECAPSIGGTPNPNLANYTQTDSGLLFNSLYILQTLLSMSQTPEYRQQALAGKIQPLVLSYGDLLPNGKPIQDLIPTLKQGQTFNITQAMMNVAQNIDTALGVIGANSTSPFASKDSINSSSGSNANGGGFKTPPPGTTIANGAQQLYNYLMQAIVLGVADVESINLQTGEVKFGSNPFYWENIGTPKNPHYVYLGQHNGISIGDVATGMQGFGAQSSLLGAHSTISQIEALVKQGRSLALDTQILGEYIKQTVCQIGANICGLGINLKELAGNAIFGKGNLQDIINASTDKNKSFAPIPKYDIPKGWHAKNIEGHIKATIYGTSGQKSLPLYVNGQKTQVSAMGNILGLQASKSLVQTQLERLISGSKSLYEISYLPNLQALNSYQSGSMNGFGSKLGYKQFFGRKRNLGLRYYGFLDYGAVNFGSGNLKVGANLVTYGAGTDLLYNVFERSRGREKTTLGFFAGIQLAGQSWFTDVLDQLNGRIPSKISHSSFQFLFDLGVRTNFSKRKPGKHTFQQGMEVGVKIPTIQHTYFKTAGASVSYLRNFSFYVGYTVGF
nr:outer membrane protein [Helicobacter cetorum]